MAFCVGGLAHNMERNHQRNADILALDNIFSGSRPLSMIRLHLLMEEYTIPSLGCLLPQWLNLRLDTCTTCHKHTK